MGRVLEILIISTNSGRGGATTMIDDLVNGFADQGHRVQVVAVPWDAPPARPWVTEDRPGVRTIWVSPRELGFGGTIVRRSSKWLMSSLLALRHVRRLRDARFDLVIGFSPAVATGALLAWATRRPSAKRYFYSLDFFPFHQRSLGLVPGGPIFAAALRLENWLIRRFDVIGCMSPANITYLKKHFRLRPEQKVAHLPLWGEVERIEVDRDAIRRLHSLPPTRPLILFGGQITEGRGIEEILATARLAATSGSDVHFVMIGRGRLVPLVEAYIAEGHGNLTRLDQLPRKDYLSAAAACDVGLIVTVPDVEVPTFPSKSMDYLRAGLPIVASVEQTTDFGDFVRERGIGAAVDAGSPDRLLSAIAGVLADESGRDAMKRNGRKALEEVFAVEKAVERIISQAMD